MNTPCSGFGDECTWPSYIGHPHDPRNPDENDEHIIEPRPSRLFYLKVINMPKVLNKYKHGIPFGSVYIGRPSKWGNPFTIGKDGTRDEVIRKHKEWIYSNPSMIATIKNELRNKDLVCFCYPQACHGDTLLSIANETVEGEEFDLF